MNRRRAKGPRLSTVTRREPCTASAPARSELDPVPAGRRPLGVALSGGGARAALASVGVLRFLADADRLEEEASADRTEQDFYRAIRKSLFR